MATIRAYNYKGWSIAKKGKFSFRVSNVFSGRETYARTEDEAKAIVDKIEGATKGETR